MQNPVIWRELAQYINAPPPCMASRCRKFERGGPKETAKEEENKKSKNPEAQETDEIEPKILAENLEEVKQFKSCETSLLLSSDFYYLYCLK